MEDSLLEGMRQFEAGVDRAFGALSSKLHAIDAAQASSDQVNWDGLLTKGFGGRERGSKMSGRNREAYRGASMGSTHSALVFSATSCQVVHDKKRHVWGRPQQAAVN